MTNFYLLRRRKNKLESKTTNFTSHAESIQTKLVNE